MRAGPIDRLLRIARRRLSQRDEPIGFDVRQRPQQNAVHHAEDGRRRADAESQRQDRDERERPLARQGWMGL